MSATKIVSYTDVKGFKPARKTIPKPKQREVYEVSIDEILSDAIMTKSEEKSIRGSEWHAIPTSAAVLCDPTTRMQALFGEHPSQQPQQAAPPGSKRCSRVPRFP
jgi:hypothetical protein